MNTEFRVKGGQDIERIYLSDVEPHAATPIDRVSDLRSRVLLHVLFADTLVIGDSQSLNYRYFRALVSADEAARVAWPAGGEALPDLAPLLTEGRIRVARRAGHTLHDIRADHLRRNVDNVPSAAYTDALAAMTAAHAVSYDMATVSEAFTAGVRQRMDAGLRQAHGDARTALEAARRWAGEQEVLVYKGIRDWLDGYRTAHPGASADVVLSLQAVDDWAGEAYRQALPRALAAGTASARDLPDVIPAASSRRIWQQAELPSAMLDAFLLSQLPVDVVLEAVAQPSRRAMVSELARLRRGLRPDPAVLRPAVEEFSAWMLAAFTRTFRPARGRAWDHLQGMTRLMRFGLEEDAATGRLGAGLEVAAPGPGPRSGNSLSLHVVTAPAEGTDAYAAPRRPLKQLDPLDRVVTG